MGRTKTKEDRRAGLPLPKRLANRALAAVTCNATVRYQLHFLYCQNFNSYIENLSEFFYFLFIFRLSEVLDNDGDNKFRM